MTNCIQCNVELVPNQNWYLGSQKDRHRVCKSCLIQRSRDYYAKHRDERIAYMNSHKKERLDKRFQKEYGITLEFFEVAILLQNNKCAICGGLLGKMGSGKGDCPVPDHDHVTGEMRGVLHHTCNAAIGLLGDNPETLIRAANYLKTVKA